MGELEEDVFTYEVLGHDLVLDEIFRQLSIPDLLACSEVNRTWNLPARRYLREKKNCFAKVQTCHELEKLSYVLEQSTYPLPYKGLFVAGGHSCVRTADPEGLVPYLIETSLFSSLKLQLHKQQGLECPLLQFLKRYFQEENPLFLEQLEVITLPNKIYTLQDTFQGMKILAPNLKTVTFPQNKREGLVEEVIGAAPGILKIKGPISEEEVSIIWSRDRVQALKEFLFEPETPSQVQLYQTLAKQQPQLESLKLSSAWYKSNGDLQSFVETGKLLLQGCRKSLKKLQIGHLDLLLFSQVGFPRMTGVETLAFGYVSAVDKAEGYCTLSRIDFQSIFPNLKNIEIIATDGLRHVAWYISPKFRESTEQYSCGSVTRLNVAALGYPIYPPWFEWMRELFPNVREISLSACYELAGVVGSVWRTWPEVEEFTVRKVGEKYVKLNMDAIFCGLFEAEVLELKKEGREFLKNYQYAPVQPSFRDLTYLQRFYIDSQHCKDFRKEISSTFLSPVTGHLAFERLPHVMVQVLRRECQNVCSPCRFMEELRPFVKIRTQ